MVTPPLMENSDPDRIRLEAAGLCSSCAHGRVIESSKRSSFLLCRLSESDSSFAKYPRLPVLSCRGYTRKGSASPKD